MNIINIILILVITLLVILYSQYKSENLSKKDMIKTLIRGCSRWAVASVQDKSPLISVLHANYAAGYLWGIKDIFSDTQVKDATGINMTQYQKKITDIQDIATKRVVVVCPQFAGEMDIYLGRTAGDI
jgi:hypothetical protein